MLHIRSMAGFGICPAVHRATPQIVLGHVGAPAARFALRGAPPSCGKIWEVTLCPACGY